MRFMNNNQLFFNDFIFMFLKKDINEALLIHGEGGLRLYKRFDEAGLM